MNKKNKKIIPFEYKHPESGQWCQIPTQDALNKVLERGLETRAINLEEHNKPPSSWGLITVFAVIAGLIVFVIRGMTNPDVFKSTFLIGAWLFVPACLITIIVLLVKVLRK